MTSHLQDSVYANIILDSYYKQENTSNPMRMGPDLFVM